MRLICIFHIHSLSNFEYYSSHAPGNADPQALQLAVATMQGCQLLGMPEADVLLSQCAIYLARAPKSREADSALAAAKRTISECKGIQPSVPMHLRNAPTKLMKELGIVAHIYLLQNDYLNDYRIWQVSQERNIFLHAVRYGRCSIY